MDDRKLYYAKILILRTQVESFPQAGKPRTQPLRENGLTRGAVGSLNSAEIKDWKWATFISVDFAG
jgi:hypothetical protein